MPKNRDSQDATPADASIIKTRIEVPYQATPIKAIQRRLARLSHRLVHSAERISKVQPLNHNRKAHIGSAKHKSRESIQDVPSSSQDPSSKTNTSTLAPTMPSAAHHKGLAPSSIQSQRCKGEIKTNQIAVIESQ
ncbi:hypothetical protein Nepgr_026661 [Nepenthes gracilis]|uniref:Uncharacterized protein n=1 Tax=Nepenthes gracilis TaxID=150966 RepID=A0AAD3T8J2_NEPGR|nr:hypothetical protein Nepgr_026661 [Nepenthes gracilis]